MYVDYEIIADVYIMQIEMWFELASNIESWQQKCQHVILLLKIVGIVKNKNKNAVVALIMKS